MKFKLEITCDNAAFGRVMRETDEEVARILRTLATHLATEGSSEGGLLDANGNTVGSYEFEGERE